jgi:hypothetical protein
MANINDDQDNASDYDSEEETDDDSDDEETMSDDDMTDMDLEEEPFSDFALLGLRLFMNRIEGLEQDAQDIETENSFQDILQEQYLPEIPSVEYITEKFIEQGITMNQLVHTLLMEHPEYSELDEAENIYYDLSYKIRRLIIEYPYKTKNSSEPSSVIPAATPQLLTHNA